jgi:hypothetical protein
LGDFSHFRREITFVNWVRDRPHAHVHLLVTQQRSASGGSRLTLTLVGLGDLAGRRDTLHVFTTSTDTYDEERRELTRALALSLVPYVWYTEAAKGLDLRFDGTDAAPSGPMAAIEPEDPWDSWVFRIRGRGAIAGESQERAWSGNVASFANRTTEDLKLDFEIYADGSRSELDYTDSLEAIDTTYVSVRNSYGFDGVAVWSLNGHWSAGLQGEVDRISTLNWDLAIRGGPAVEYNIFPYDESTWRRLSVRYSAGVAAFDYADTTVFFETSEVRPLHTLNVELGIQQPWGSLRGNVRALQYLHDLTKHSFTPATPGYASFVGSSSTSARVSPASRTSCTYRRTTSPRRKPFSGCGPDRRSFASVWSSG